MGSKLLTRVKNDEHRSNMDRSAKPSRRVHPSESKAIAKKDSAASDKAAETRQRLKNVDLAAHSLPKAEPALPLDVTPRRSYTPDVPASYPTYRNHVINHLRRHLSLQEIVSVRLADFHWSPEQITIGEKQIASRMIAEVCEAFLSTRAQLAEAIPSLKAPEAFLFPALDGGQLFVSHRPKGMLDTGLKAFVETRDALLNLMCQKLSGKKDFDFLVNLNTIQLEAALANPTTVSSLGPNFETLVKKYLKARTEWMDQVEKHWRLIDGHANGRNRSPLTSAIKALENKDSLSRNQRRQLRELREVRDSFDNHKDDRYNRQFLRNPALKNSPVVQALIDNDHDPLDDERITPAIVPVYRPNRHLCFLGSDGGKLIGDV
jgi:hypothetical protein